MKGTARTTRWLPLFVAGVMLILAGLVSNTAKADGVSGTFSDVGIGQFVWSGGVRYWGGILYLDIDDDGSLQTYCIDFGTDTGPGVRYTEGTWNSANVANLGEVTWVLRHGYPTVSAAALAEASGVAAGDLIANDVAAATQAAIWHFSDGLTLDAYDPATHAPNYEPILAVYAYLVDHASSVPEPPAALSVTPASLQGTVGEKIGPFTVATSADSVALSSTGGTITDAVGTPLTIVSNGETFFVTVGTVGTVTVVAQATAPIPSGRVFLTIADTPKQKLIAASMTSARTSVEVSVSSEDTTTTQAVTTTTQAVTTTTQAVTTTTQAVTTTIVASQGPIPTAAATTTTVAAAGSGVLPHTGPSSGWTAGSQALTGAGLTLIGLSLLIVARRRPV